MGLRNLDVKPLDWAPSINAFLEKVAKDAPRGSYPRSFFGEQEYWTVVGVDGDREEGLLGEDGALEVGQGAFSIEPFLFVDGKLITWSDVTASQSLAEGYLPIPTVTWTRGDLSLDITAFASGPPGDSVLRARYRRPEPRRRGETAASLPRDPAVPGEPADAVSQPARRRLLDPRDRLGRPCGPGER